MRFLKVLALVATSTLMMACGDEITNEIFENVVTPNTPDMRTPTDTRSPTNTPTPGEPPMGCREPEDGEEVVCGDGICVGPEQCDDGGFCVGGDNAGQRCTSADGCPGGGTCTVVGGQQTDGGTCAANCTLEDRREAAFSSETSAFVQTAAFQVPVALSGSQVVLTGQMRSDDTVDINGEVTFRAGDIPIVSKSDGLRIDPAPVAPLVCACVRGIEVPAFGPGNAGIGVISCGGELEGVDYTITQDHHTDPLTDFQPVAECALPADPTCSATSEVAPGVLSEACREGEGEACSMETNTDFGVCISPRTLEQSGSGPPGSAILFNNIAIGLLADSGRCEPMDCSVPDYGPDCMPCTGDDATLGVPQSNPTTTGVANARIFNLENVAGDIMNQGTGTACVEDADCGGNPQCGIEEVCQPGTVGGDTVCGVSCGGQNCRTARSGVPFSCSALQADSTGGLSGGAFAVAFPSIDSATIGDNVTTAIFQFEE